MTKQRHADYAPDHHFRREPVLWQGNGVTASQAFGVIRSEESISERVLTCLGEKGWILSGAWLRKE